MAILHFPELTLTNGKTYNDLYCELPLKTFDEFLTTDEETFMEFYYINGATDEIPLAIRNTCIASYELAFLFDDKEEADDFDPAELLADEAKEKKTCNCKDKCKTDTDGDKKKDDIFFADVDDYVDILAKVIAESPTLKSLYSNVLH